MESKDIKNMMLFYTKIVIDIFFQLSLGSPKTLLSLCYPKLIKNNFVFKYFKILHLTPILINKINLFIYLFKLNILIPLS